MLSTKRRSTRVVSSTATRVYQLTEWLLILALNLEPPISVTPQHNWFMNASAPVIRWSVESHNMSLMHLSEAGSWQVLLFGMILVVVVAFESRSTWLSVLLYVVIFPISIARRKCLDAATRDFPTDMFATNFQISVVSFLYAFLPYFRPFGLWTPLPDMVITFLGYLLSPNDQFTATLHMHILQLGRELVGSSLNTTELALISQALTAFTVYYLDSFNDGLAMPFQETFLFCFLWGLLIAVSVSIPFLQKNVKLAKIKPHQRPKNNMKQRYYCAFYTYAIIAFVILTVVRSFLVQQLYMDPFHFISAYLISSPTRLALVAYWACVAGAGVIIVVYFWGSKPVGGISGLPYSALRLLRHSSTNAYHHLDEDDDVFFEEEDTLARRARALDRRRKFFHGLVVILFLPTINRDPALSYLALSLAMAAFIFEEVLRATVLPPFGLAIHKFLSGFTDHRDKAGHLVVSHLFLLIGVAAPVWLSMTGESKESNHIASHARVGSIAMLSGVLTLGAGDAAASIVGKKFGRHKWPFLKKSVEGTAAFILAMMLSGLVTQRLHSGGTEIDWTRFTTGVVATGIMEAVSTQNDNLIIPIFMWCMVYR